VLPIEQIDDDRLVPLEVALPRARGIGHVIAGARLVVGGDLVEDAVDVFVLQGSDGGRRREGKSGRERWRRMARVGEECEDQQ
jgi:hypothetical protein